MKPEVNIMRISAHAKIPTRGSEYAAGYDLYSSEDIVIEAGETRIIPTGIVMEIPNGYFGAIYARSGLAVKQGLRPANCVGVIDSDYRGEIMVAMRNESDEYKIIQQGDRMAQIVITPYLDCSLCEVFEMDRTQRGAGGFGSTGVK